jgi:hypothetical protein
MKSNKSNEELQTDLEKLSIVNSLKNLLSFPWILDRYNSG